MTDKNATISALRALIAELVDGGHNRLPAERQLAESLNVSRHALRLSLAQMETEGLIWRNVGKGTFIGQRPTNSADDLMLIGSFTNPEEVLEVRAALEPSLAALAAMRATSEDFKQLHHFARKCETAPDSKTYEYWDGQLHRAIAVASRNRLMLALFDAVNAVRTNTVWGGLRAASLNKERQRMYCGQHNTFVKAIIDRDPSKAEYTMKKHILTVTETFLTNNQSN